MTKLKTDEIIAHEIKNAQALWQAVIIRAFMDACSPCNNAKDKINSLQARKWFSVKDSDFRLVCAFAGVNPERVASKARELIQAKRSKMKISVNNSYKFNARAARKKKAVPLRKDSGIKLIVNN